MSHLSEVSDFPRHRHEHFTTIRLPCSEGKLEAQGGKIHFPVTEPDGPHPRPAQPQAASWPWGGCSSPAAEPGT